MRRELRGALRALVGPTLALVVVGAFAPGRLELAARVYALVVCAVAVGLALRALRHSYPPTSAFRRPAARNSGDRHRPSSLARIEHETALGMAGAFDLHYHLIPRIRAIAAGLLAARRRISIDDAPDAASAILGREVWELVRRDSALPEDRLARGLSTSELRRVVESLERI